MKKITLLLSVCLFFIISNTYSQVLPTSISVSPASISMRFGEMITCTPTILPSNTSDQSITWSSSNEAVAIVNPNGVITATSVGTATITATCNADSQIFTTVPVTVAQVLPTSITITPSTLTTQLGDPSTFLTYTMLPANTTNTSVTWSSSNPEIANVNPNGVVTGLSIGTAVITVTSLASPNIFASATFICEFFPIHVTSIECYVPKTQLLVGETIQNTPFISPSTATDNSVSYSSSDVAIATVNPNGVITAISQGTVNITATTLDGGFSCTDILTVNSLPITTNKCTNHDAPSTLFDTIQYVVSAQDQLRGFAEVSTTCLREMDYIYVSNINRSYFRFQSEAIYVEIPVLQHTLDFYVWGYNTVDECYSDSAKIVFIQTPCNAGNVDIIGNSEITINPEDAMPVLEATGANVTWFDANYEPICQSSTISIDSLPIPLHTGTLRLYAASKYINCYGNPDSVKINFINYKIEGTVDALVPGMKVRITQNGISRIVSVNTDSTFTFETRTPGAYTIELLHSNFPEINKSASATISSTTPHATINFTNINDILSQISDVSISISSLQQAVVGRSLWYSVNIVNNGLAKVDLPLFMHVDSNYIVSKVLINNIEEQIDFDTNNDNLYTIPSVSSFSRIQAIIYGTVKPDWTITGKKMETMVYIPQNTDSNPINDTATCTNVILNSCDPNDKAVSPSFGEEGYVLFNQPLQYNIRFQNTGSFNAENIVIKDTIDSNLNIATFSLTNQSHPMTWQIEDNVVIFSFANIYLPDSTSDEPGSHGFVSYTISPNQGLGENTIVENTAHIFFDFNPAVVTNTTVSEYVSSFPEIIVEPLSINENSKSEITIYPVPAKENIIITNSIGAHVTIADIHGKIVKTIPVYTGGNISVKDLPSGIYVIRIGEHQQRMLIEK